MIVIDTVVAMSMRGPKQVFFQTMRMPVLRDHFGMLLKNVEDCGRVGGYRHYRPDKNGRAEKRRECGLSDCP